MNRRFQRHHDDNTTSEWWVNSTHVVAVFPHSSNTRLCYVETIRDTRSSWSAQRTPSPES